MYTPWGQQTRTDRGQGEAGVWTRARSGLACRLPRGMCGCSYTPRHAPTHRDRGHAAIPVHTPHTQAQTCPHAHTGTEGTERPRNTWDAGRGPAAPFLFLHPSPRRSTPAPQPRPYLQRVGAEQPQHWQRRRDPGRRSGAGGAAGEPGAKPEGELGEPGERRGSAGGAQGERSPGSSCSFWSRRADAAAPRPVGGGGGDCAGAGGAAAEGGVAPRPQHQAHAELKDRDRLGPTDTGHGRTRDWVRGQTPKDTAQTRARDATHAGGDSGEAHKMQRPGPRVDADPPGLALHSPGSRPPRAHGGGHRDSQPQGSEPSGCLHCAVLLGASVFSTCPP